MRSTLMLNASYEPLSVVSAQRAVTLIARGKAVSLDASPVDFAYAGGAINVPYVALLTTHVRRNSTHVRGIGYSRRGVLVRDNFTCQFCGNYGDTIDHVVPQSKGGLSSYENCVTACKSCNFKKANKSLKEMGWELPGTPRTPSVYEHLLQKAGRDSEAFPIWSGYIEMWAPKKDRLMA